MSKVEQLRKDRPNFIKDIKKAVQGSSNGPATPILYLTIATVVCLIGATIPHLATFRLFAQTALFCLILLVITIVRNRKQLPVKQLKRSAAIIGFTMALTGCSGLFIPDFSQTTPLIEYLQQADNEYKTGHADGIALFGYGLDDATIEQAMKNGNITKAYAVQERSSYGWIAVAKVKVYGE
jgi:hypothetical protein